MNIKPAQKVSQINNTPGNSSPFIWKSVVTGGGGFIPGIIFHPSVPGLCYLRTDMGGAYRRDPGSGSWVNITDMFGKEETDYYGVLSMAAGPDDAGAVYMLNGKYTDDKDPYAAFHASKDRGKTWSRTMLPFKAGGNEPGRGTGERIAVDPNLNTVIFMGSTKDGLWKSIDSGATWARLESFIPEKVNFVLIDGSSGRKGSPSGVIFAGAAETEGNSLYVSTDGGVQWEQITGQPAGVMAMRAQLSGAKLYVTFSDSPGPYGATKGSVWVYDTGAKDWKKLGLPEGEGGFSGISVDAANPEHILVSTLNRYKPHDEVFRSTDAGITWKGLIAGAEWDSSYAPYAEKIPPHWITDVKIDPFNPERAVWNTGYGIWSTEKLSSEKVTWVFDDEGIEQSVAMQIVSPPAGASLYSAMGDIDGFRHDDPDVSPDTRYIPNAKTTLSLAVAWKKPGIMVKAFNSRLPFGAYSEDCGRTWKDFGTCPAGTTRGGLKSIAVSSDGKTIVWAPKGAAMSYSADKGSSWKTCAGIKEKVLWPLADTQYPEKFYAYDGVMGIMYESRDGGKSFGVRASNLPKSPSHPGDDGMADYSAAAVPGAEEEVFITTGTGGLYRILNGKDGAEKIKPVDEAYRVGFGKEAPGFMYPVIYIWGKINGIAGFFMSKDEGRTWARINDDRHQYGWIHCITGDPKIYGRCYISAEGRGILYGEHL